MGKSAAMTEILEGNAARAKLPPAATVLPAPRPLSRKDKGLRRDTTAVWLPLAHIEPDPDQPRKEFDDDALKELMYSIIKQGQLQAITVRWDAARDSYVIVTGERRYRAMKRGELAEIRCTVLPPGEATEDEEAILTMQVTENVVRENLSPVEEGRSYRRIMEIRQRRGEDASMRALSEILKVKLDRIDRALKLDRADPAVKEAVERGDIVKSKAEEIARVPDAAEQRALLERAIADKLPQEQIKEEARQAKKRTGGPTRTRESVKTVIRITQTYKVKDVTFTHMEGATLQEMLAAHDEARQVLLDRIEADAAIAETQQG